MSVARFGAPAAATTCWLAVAVGVALLGAEGPDRSGFLVVDVVQGMLYPVIGAVVARARPRNAVGWLLLVVGAGHAAAVLAGGVALAAERSAATGLGSGALWLESWVWFVGLGPLTTVLPLLLPDGRSPSRGWRPLLWANVALVAASTVAIALNEQLEVRPGVFRDNPVGVPGAGAASGVLLVLCAVGSVAALAGLLVRWRRAGADLRRQLLPPTAAFAVIVAALGLASFVPSLELLLQTVALPLLPLACAVAVLRYRLFDIELLIRRSVVYVLVSGVLLAAYAGTVTGLGALLGDRATPIGPLLATGLVAVGFSPVRTAVQRTVARWLFGNRDDPALALGDLARRLEQAAPPDERLGAVAATVRDALRLRFVAVRDCDGQELGHAGTSTAAHEQIPLIADGENEGELVVADRGDGAPLSPQDLALLAELAPPIATAVRSVRLARQVQQSREQLVWAREEERRRLRRDLHDGVGATVAAVTVQLDVVDGLWERDPAAARELLRDVRSSATRAVRDIRRIVHGLRPAALDELGLAGALTELASEGSAGTAVRVEVEGLPPLAAATEVAAYRIAQEALGNALRHAAARNVWIRVKHEPLVLAVEVIDDGSGVAADAAAGTGTASMRERAAELGGTSVRHGLPTGGTRVYARLPLEAQ